MARESKYPPSPYSVNVKRIDIEVWRGWSGTEYRIEAIGFSKYEDDDVVFYHETGSALLKDSLVRKLMCDQIPIEDIDY